jgi:cytosine deaminase
MGPQRGVAPTGCAIVGGGVTLEWLLRECRLAGHDGTCDVGIAGGRVVAVAPRLEGPAIRELAVRGRLVLPGFRNAHARLLAPARELEGRAALVLETAIRHGTTAIRLSVPLDPDEPLMPLRLLARLRTRVRERIRVELSPAVPSAVLDRPRAVGALLASARRAGAEAIDVQVERESLDALGLLIGQLGETGLDLDLAVDTRLPPQGVAADALVLSRVVELLSRGPIPSPVRVLHATALAAVHRDDAAPLARALAALGVPLVVCPLETLRQAGREDAVATRRGLPRLRELLTAGMTLALGSGSCQEAAALDPLAAVWLAAYASHMGMPAALEPARRLVAPGRIEPGVEADLVVLEAPSFARAVVDHAEKVAVFKGGRLVHQATRASEMVEVRAPGRLVIRGATLLRQAGRHDIVVQEGVIQEITPRAGPADGVEIAAEGRLVVPAFVDAHLHVDKAFVMDACPLGEAILTVPEAVAAMRAVKAAYTADDLIRRGRLTLTRALRHGTTAVRAQCDVDPVIGLLALEALLALRREFADRLDLQIVAFPQEGLLGAPGAVAVMRLALKAGADLVGGGPLDADYGAHIAQAFALAREFGVPVDLHADLAIDRLRPLDEWEAPLVARHARAAGLGGRVAIGHFAASSALTREQVRGLARTLADAGVHVAALVASELYRQGLDDPVNSRRGVPRVADLLESGVNVVFASNNIRDAFVTFGTADMLEQALLGATAAHLNDPDTALDMVTARPAALMGLPARGSVVVGNQADLVILDARSAAQAIGDQAEKLFVIRRGQVIIVNRVESRSGA